MSTSSINNKSQQINARIPHEVVEGMEAVKMEGESNAGFIVTAMQGEITRRQLKESDESKLISNLNDALIALAKIEEIGIKTGADIRAIVDIAQNQTKRPEQSKKPKE